MPDLTVSLVTADNKALILDCLRSICDNSDGLDIETYVVLNASNDDSEQSINEQFPHVKLIINEEKLGFTHNHNMVMRRGKGRYFLVLNDDTVILDNALKKMVDFMDGSEDVGVVGCKILNGDKSLQWSCGKAFSHKLEYLRSGLLRPALPFLPVQHFKKTKQVSWLTGACIMARAKATREVGLFDENIVIYYEDGDWCYRMIQEGWKVVFYPEAEIIHYHGQTRKHHLARDTFIIFQSKLYFFTKHYSMPTQLFVRSFMVAEVLLRLAKGFISSVFDSTQREQANQLAQTYRRVIQMALAPCSIRCERSNKNRASRVT